MASPFNLKYKHILNSGLSKVSNLIANIQSLPITKFELGSSVNYDPDLNQTSVLTPVFDDTNPLASGNFEISTLKLDNTKVQIDLLINNFIGDFDIGEIILKFSDGTPFIIVTLETVFPKFKDPGGNAFQISIIVNILNSDVIVPTASISIFNSLNIVNDETMLPGIGNASSNTYLIRNYNNTGSFALAFKYTVSSSWRFTTQVQGNQNENEILVVSGDRNSKSSGKVISSSAAYAGAELVNIPDKQSIKDFLDATYLKLGGGNISGFITKSAGDLEPVTSGQLSTKDYVDFKTDTIKNKILNGCLRFWQRALSFTNPSSGSYIADRFMVNYNGSGSTFSISRQSFTAGELEGHGLYSKFFLRYNRTVAATSQTVNQIKQKIENVRSLAGRNVTLSFYAKASSNVIISTGAAQNLGPSGVGTPTTISDQNHSLTTSWVKYSWSFQFSSLLGMTIDDAVSPGSSSYSEIKFNLPNNSAITIDLAYIQLEVGKSSSYFDLRPASIELEMLLRYFEKTYDLDVSPGTVTNYNGCLSCMASGNGVGIAQGQYYYKVIKRSIPTVSFYNPETGAVGSMRRSNGADVAASSLNVGVSNLTWNNSATTANTPIRHDIHIILDSEI